MPNFWEDPKFTQKYGRKPPKTAPASTTQNTQLLPEPAPAAQSSLQRLPDAAPVSRPGGREPNTKQSGPAHVVAPGDGPVTYQSLVGLGERDKPIAYVKGVSGSYEPVDLYKPDPAKLSWWDSMLSNAWEGLMAGSNAAEGVVGAQVRRSTNPLVNFSTNVLPFFGRLAEAGWTGMFASSAQNEVKAGFLEDRKAQITAEAKAGWEQEVSKLDDEIVRLRGGQQGIAEWQRVQSDLTRSWKELWNPSAPKIDDGRSKTDAFAGTPWDQSLDYTKQYDDSQRLYAEASNLRSQAYSILRDLRSQMNPQADPQSEFERVINAARGLISQAQQKDIEGSSWYDPSWSWSLNINPQRRMAYEAALVEAEMQAGRPLEPWEMIRIKEHFVDPWEEGAGQLVGDFYNLVPIEKLADVAKFIGRGSQAALISLTESPAIQKALKATGATVSKVPWIAEAVEAAIRPGRDLFAWATRQAVSSSANQLRREVFDVLERVAKATDTTRGDARSFQSLVEDIGANLGNREALRAILPASLGDRELKILERAAGVINPGEWGRMIDDAYEDVLKTVFDRAMLKGGDELESVAQIAKAAADNPTNIVEALAKEFQSSYRTAHTLPGSVGLAEDSALLQIARAMNVIDSPASAERLQSLADAGDKVAARTLDSMVSNRKLLVQITNWSDRVGRWWTNMVLSARPGWSIRNLMDSYARYMLNGGSLFDGLGSILSTDFAKAAEEHPFVISALADVFARSELEAEQGVARRMIGGWKPEGGPLSFIRWEWERLHPNQQSLLERLGRASKIGTDLLSGAIDPEDLVKALKESPLSLRRGVGELGAAWSAWSNGWKDFNASVEFTTRIRMYHNQAVRLYPVLEREALPLVMGYVKDRPMAQTVLHHLWDEAGQDPEKFRQLYDNFLNNASATGRIDWSFLVPSNFAKDMSSEDREMFVRPIVRGLENLRATNGGILPPDKLKVFFDDVRKQLEEAVIEKTRRLEQQSADDLAHLEAAQSGAVNAAQATAVSAKSTRGPVQRMFLDTVKRVWPKAGLQSKKNLIADFTDALTFGTVVDAVTVDGDLIRILTDESGQRVVQIGRDAFKLKGDDLRGRMFGALADAMFESERESLMVAFGAEESYRASLSRFFDNPELLARDDPERFKRLAELFDRNPQMADMAQAVVGKNIDYGKYLPAFDEVKFDPIAKSKRLEASISAAPPSKYPKFVDDAGRRQAAAVSALSRRIAPGVDPTLTLEQRKFAQDQMWIWDRVQEVLQRFWLEEYPGPLHKTGPASDAAWRLIHRMKEATYDAGASWMREINSALGGSHEGLSFLEFWHRNGMDIQFNKYGQVRAIGFDGSILADGRRRQYLSKRSIVSLNRLLEKIHPPAGATAREWMNRPMQDWIFKPLIEETIDAVPVSNVAAVTSAAPSPASVAGNLADANAANRLRREQAAASLRASLADAEVPDSRKLTEAEIDERITEELKLLNFDPADRDQVVESMRIAMADLEVPTTRKMTEAEIDERVAKDLLLLNFHAEPTVIPSSAAPGAPVMPVYHVRVGISPSSNRIGYVENVHRKALELTAQMRAGDTAARQQLSELLTSFGDWAQEDLKTWLDGIEGLEFRSQNGVGAFYGDVEPTIPVEMRVPVDKKDEVLGRLIQYASSYQQSNFHIRMQLKFEDADRLGFAMGQVLDDGSVIEPQLRLEFKRALTLPEIEDLYTKFGLPGASVTHDGRTLTVYNVSQGVGADDSVQFRSKVRNILEYLRDLGDVLAGAFQAPVRLWNYGDAGYGGTRTYAEALGELPTEAFLSSVEARRSADPIQHVLGQLDQDDLLRLAFNDEIDNLLSDIRNVPEEGPFFETLADMLPWWGKVPQSSRTELVETLIRMTQGKYDTPLAQTLRPLVAERLAYGHKAGDKFLVPSNPYVVEMLGLDPATIQLSKDAWRSRYGFDDVTAYLKRLQASYRDAELEQAWRAWTMTPRYGGKSVIDLWGQSAASSYDGFLAHLRDYRDRLVAQYGPERTADLVDALRLLEQEAVNFRNQSARMSGLPQELFARVDDLSRRYPVQIPYWKLPEDTQTWLYRADDVIAQGSQANAALDEWYSYLLKDVPELYNTPLDPADLDALRAAFDPAVQSKYNLLNTTIYGGEWMGRNVQGALPKTQTAMLDYQTFNNFDETMRMLFPFWLFPSRSLPYWIEYMALHPQLPAFYAKYIQFSETQAIQAGAMTTSGSPLPSLKGYVRVPGSHTWINPSAALSFRYAIPQPPSQYQSDEEGGTTMIQRTYSWLNEMGQNYGFTLSPWLVQIGIQAGWQDVNEIPAWSLIPQMDLIPPWAQREVMQRIRQVASNAPEMWSPQVSWKDYLIERQLLTETLQRMQAPNLSEDRRYQIAVEAKQALLRRESDDLWLAARNTIEQSTYYTTVAGYFTGMFGKEFSDADAELLSLRTDLNALRDAVNAEVQAGLFGLPPDDAERYNMYLDARYSTPDGYLASLYSNIRYVRTPEGNPAYGDERRELIGQSITEDEITSAYYEKLNQLQKERDAALAAVPIGASGDLRQKIWDDYSSQRAAVESDDTFALARRGWVAGFVKPQEMVDQHYLDSFMFAVRDTRPKYDPSKMSYAEWQAEVLDWEQNFPSGNILPGYRQGMIDALAKDVRSATTESERQVAENNLTRARLALDGLSERSSFDQFRQWEISRDTPIDALNEAWRSLYWNPYWDALGDLSGPRLELAKRDFYVAHPKPPSPDELVAWVSANYPPKQFDPSELMSIAIAAPVQDIEDRLAPKDEQAKLTSLVFDILAWAGPGKAKSEFIEAYVRAGGSRDDITVIYETGGAWRDPNKLAEVAKLMTNVAGELGMTSPSSATLAQWVVAQELNDKYRSDAEKKFGADIFKVISDYGSASSSVKREMKSADPRIQAFYDFRDKFAVMFPEWSEWYVENKGSRGGTATSSGTSSSAPWWEQLYGGAETPTVAPKSTITTTKTSMSVSLPTTSGTAAPNPYATTPQVSTTGVEQWRGMATEYGSKFGVPPEYVMALILAESGGNAYAVGDQGHSVGLFQLHDKGVGYGMTVEQRQDPRVQFEAMMPRISAAYNKGVAQGLQGADLAIFVGREAERPAAGAERRYGVTYSQIVGGTAPAGTTVAISPTPAPASESSSAPVSAEAMVGEPPSGPTTPGVSLLNKVLADALAKGITPTFTSSSEVYDFADYIMDREKPGILKTWEEFKATTTLRGYEAGQAFWDAHPELKTFDEFRSELIKRFNAAQKGADDKSFQKGLEGDDGGSGGGGGGGRSGGGSSRTVGNIRVSATSASPVDFQPLGYRATLNARDLLDLSRLGRGGVGGKPVWPRALFDKWGEPPAGLVEALGETAIKDINAAVESGAPLLAATKKLIGNLADRHPNWAKLLKNIGEFGSDIVGPSAGAPTVNKLYLPGLMAGANPSETYLPQIAKETKPKPGGGGTGGGPHQAK